jgi:5-methylthioadenosine/S-adenosylhomocysteine deaminase
MEKVDTLINARWVVPVEPDCRAHDRWSIAIHNGRIAETGPTPEINDRFEATETIDRLHHAVLPGFINAHTHAGMSLMRGIADDLPLMDWLKGHIWPAEQKWVSPEFVADGTELAIAEMLRSGTTCFADMYFFPDVVARTAARLGMRACPGLIAIEFASAWAENAAEYLSKGLAVRDEYKSHPLITTVFAPHAPYTLSDKSLLKIRRLSDELEIPVQIHLHETSDEIAQSMTDHRKRPIERLDELGLLTPLLLAVHMTQLEDREIELAATRGINVIHCPESNMKLASGACPVPRLVESGVNVALGTDGAASNNDLDMIGEMKTAALLAKHEAGSAAVLTARDVLRMATINGARALGLAEETGSLVRGKWADINCIDLRHIQSQPVYDPVAQIVYAAGREQVTDVWVAGRQLVAGGVLTRIDEIDLMERADAWCSKLAGQSQRVAR